MELTEFIEILRRFAPFASIFIVFPAISLAIKLVRSLMLESPSVPALPSKEDLMSKKQKLKLQSKEEIESGTFDVDAAIERWANYYEEQMAK